MIDFRDLPSAREFELRALPYLRAAVVSFFGGSVKYDAQPVGAIRRQHQIDITENPRRGVYLVNDGKCAVVLGRVLDGRDVKAAFALQITEASFAGMERVLNVFEAALAITLSLGAHRKFFDKPHQYGDELLELTISKFFSKGRYDHRKVQHLLELFHSLANAKFEGRNFTTGLVVTRSHYAFAEKNGHSREGTLFRLTEIRDLMPSPTLDKRFWYLADGQTSFFISNPALEVSNLFLTNSTRQSLASFVDDYSLSKTIRGSDLLFRVTSQSEFAVAGSAGIEFGFREGRWKVRNLDRLAALISDVLQVGESIVQSFLYYVFYLSRRRLSSILWVPKDASNVDAVLLSKNQLTCQPLSIVDEAHTHALIRLLSSDGASIIGRDGTLISFGSVVDISKIEVQGIKGTGESVAALLGQNGVAVKVSQDGTIKLYAGAARPHVI